MKPYGFDLDSRILALLAEGGYPSGTNASAALLLDLSTSYDFAAVAPLLPRPGPSRLEEPIASEGERRRKRAIRLTVARRRNRRRGGITAKRVRRESRGVEEVPAERRVWRLENSERFRTSLAILQA